MQQPGWYNDGTGNVRWWDGTRWTEHVRALSDIPGSRPVGISSRYPAPVPQPYPAPAGTQYPNQAVPPSRGVNLLAIVAIVIGALAFGGIFLWITVASSGAHITLPATAESPSTEAGLDSSVSPSTTVLDYSQAWSEVDCTLLKTTVTDSYFSQTYGNCSQFVSAAENFLSHSPDDYFVAINSENVLGSVATVTTTETYTYDGENQVTYGTYVLRVQDGSWRIASVEFVDDDGYSSSTEPDGVT